MIMNWDSHSDERLIVNMIRYSFIAETALLRDGKNVDFSY